MGRGYILTKFYGKRLYFNEMKNQISFPIILHSIRVYLKYGKHSQISDSETKLFSDR